MEFVWQSSAPGHGDWPGVIHPVTFHRRKQVPSTKTFLVEGGASCPVHLGFFFFWLVWTCVGLMGTVTKSLHIHICISCVWSTLFSESHSPPVALTSFLPPLLHRPLNLESMKTYYLGLWTSKSFTLCTLFICVFLFITIYYNKFPWWGLSDTLIYRCSNMSLGVISLVCPFTRIIVVSFPLGLLLI